MTKFVSGILLAVGAFAACNFLQLTFLPAPGHPTARVPHPVAVAAGTVAASGAAPALAAAGVDEAAKKLAVASYPLVQAVDWTNPAPLTKYLATGAQSNKAAISAVLDVAVSLDPSLVRKAVEAHKKALEAADGRLKTPLINYEEVTIAIANMLASAPPAKVFSVVGAIPSLNQLNSDWMASLNAADVNAAWQAYLQTAQVVKR